jgi:hypothetical protein
MVENVRLTQKPGLLPIPADFGKVELADLEAEGFMTKDACQHRWAMANIRHGYLVIEGCFHCRRRISFFSDEPVPPIDDYMEGEHFWSHLGDFQASKFDLRCEKCSTDVPMTEIMALILCMRCNPECSVFKAGAAAPGQKAWVYVALCADTSHTNGKCVPEAGLKALNEYFNTGLHDPGKLIRIVPCELRKSVDTCQGVVLADVGLTEIY